jgi:Ca-activated chloride channel family protein
LPFEDGEATYRLPLVVAPRYIPGAALAGEQAGSGYASDTDATPDASRITPPVLLPGFPNPVALSIEVEIDPGGLPLGEVRSSLHTVSTNGNTIRIQPGERVDRDFILRLPYGDDPVPASALTVHADDDGDEGTYQLTVLPPTETGTIRPKDVVLVLDRSGSMQGWKMVAARRSAARVIDTLGGADRFAVLTFDNVVERPDGLPSGLAPASDRNRYRAVEHLSRADARGGTELLAPLQQGLALLSGAGGERDRALVLVTDGQVGNEDQILDTIAMQLRGIRVHAIGIDRAVNAGFLDRLATTGGGRCELVESEERLDAAMAAIHRRISTPLVTGLHLAGDGLADATATPARLPDMFSGVPFVVRGRYRNSPPRVTLTGTTRDGAPWQIEADATPARDGAITEVWARAMLRDLEDGYASNPGDPLEQRIVATSLRFGVLCRFTAFVAVDSRVVNDGGEVHRVVQPVELPSGWEPAGYMLASAAAMPAGSVLSSSRPARRPQRMAVRALSPDAAGPPIHDVDAEMRAARRVAADEARRLDQAVSSEGRRRDVLGDLAARLEALARHLDGLGIDATALRRIVKTLRDESVPTAARWETARRALTDFAADAPATQRQFWKRQ